MGTQVEKMYNRLQKSWEALPDVTKNNAPTELSKATYGNNFGAYVLDMGSKMIAEDEVLASDPEGSCNYSTNLHDAVSCGYVSFSEGEYRRAEDKPLWVHPSMRTAEENEEAKKQALSGRGGY